MTMSKEAVEIVAMAISPPWWENIVFDPEWKQLRCALDNYPGQHLKVQALLRQRAEAALSAALPLCGVQEDLESSCCQEDGEACGPFVDQEREIVALEERILDYKSALEHSTWLYQAVLDLLREVRPLAVDGSLAKGIDAHLKAAMLASAPPSPAQEWKHKKRGTTYREIGRAELQMNSDLLVQGVTMVVYAGEDGKLWCREEEEFEDGRFEPLPSPPPSQGEQVGTTTPAARVNAMTGDQRSTLRDGGDAS